MGITSKSIDVRPGDIVSQASDNRRNNAHSPGNLRFCQVLYKHITFRHCQQHMPRQRHVRRHAVVSYGTGVKPPKPGASLSCEAMWPVSNENAAVRDQSGPGKVFLSRGRISALAGRQGRAAVSFCLQSSLRS